MLRKKLLNLQHPENGPGPFSPHTRGYTQIVSTRKFDFENGIYVAPDRVLFSSTVIRTRPLRIGPCRPDDGGSARVAHGVVRLIARPNPFRNEQLTRKHACKNRDDYNTVINVIGEQRT